MCVISNQKWFPVPFTSLFYSGLLPATACSCRVPWELGWGSGNPVGTPKGRGDSWQGTPSWQDVGWLPVQEGARGHLCRGVSGCLTPAAGRPAAGPAHAPDGWIPGCLHTAPPFNGERTCHASQMKPHTKMLTDCLLRHKHWQMALLAIYSESRREGGNPGMGLSLAVTKSPQSAVQ